MLAKETAEAFDDADWIFEVKWDGYRGISEINNGSVSIYSRNGNSFNNSYPVIVDALAGMHHNVILDGEIVVFDEDGKPDFQKLQQYEHNTQYPICYYVFDVLSINGTDTYDLPLTNRKKLLKKIIVNNPVIKYSDHVEAKGKSLFATAIEKQLEGIIAKKASSQYYPGVRSDEWLKIKNHRSVEVVIAGFTAPAGSRKYFGALVLGIPEEGKLKYAGHTGSGFDEQKLKELYSLLKPLIRNRSPFAEAVKTNAPVTWVKPALVCEVKFTEWTKDKRMRHPIFLRMRPDKSIKDTAMQKKKKRSVKAGVTGEAGNEKILAFGSTKVKTTNLDKIFWPKEKITKGMVIDYYQQMAAYILPYLKDRPQSLKRNPNGILDKGFFHKDAGSQAPSWVKRKEIYSASAKKEIDYIICNNAATLAYLNNLGCIELNPWNSTVRALDKPDYLVIDLDPSEKNSFNQVVATANAFKELLDAIGAASYCKTSGATGLHVFVPMGKKYAYEQVKDFAHLLCMYIEEQLPAFTTLERSLAKRGNNKIYLDYLQNRRGQTVASVYSLRPHAGATVSTPLHWQEVKPGLDPADFTIDSIVARVKQQKDIFSPVLGKGIDLKKCLDRVSALMEKT
jgi:bifunctional non-homologous end joining protein LigD